jgi:RPA family protein
MTTITFINDAGIPELTSKKYDLYKTAIHAGEYVAIIGVVRNWETDEVLNIVIRTIAREVLVVHPTDMTDYCL